MRRRLRRLLGITLVMGVVAVVAVAIAATVALNTDWGREITTRRVRAMLAEQLAPGTEVEMHGLFLTPIGTARLDSLVLRDSAGVVVAALRGLRVAVGIRAAFDRELHFTSVVIERLELDVVQDASGQWNFQSVARAADTTSVVDAESAAPWRIRIDTLSWLAGSIAVTRPDTLPTLPPRRDVARAVAVELGPTVLNTAGPSGTIAIARAQGTVDVTSTNAGDVAGSAARTRELTFLAERGTVTLDSSTAVLAFPALQLGASRLSLDNTTN